MPQKPYVPTEDTRRQVRLMSGLAVPHADIARILGIHIETLTKHYPEDIAAGRAEANLKVARAMFKAATRDTNPNVVAGMFWLKNRGGWKDIGNTTNVTINGGIDTPPRSQTWEEWHARWRADIAALEAPARPTDSRH